MPDETLHCANPECGLALFDRPFLDARGRRPTYAAWVWSDQLYDEVVCFPHRLSPAGLVPRNHKYHHPTRKDYRPYSRKLRELALTLVTPKQLETMLEDTNDIYQVLQQLGVKI